VSHVRHLDASRTLVKTHCAINTPCLRTSRATIPQVCGELLSKEGRSKEEVINFHHKARRADAVKESGQPGKLQTRDRQIFCKTKAYGAYCRHIIEVGYSFKVSLCVCSNGERLRIYMYSTYEVLLR
jgi:hypothetical protein